MCVASKNIDQITYFFPFSAKWLKNSNSSDGAMVKHFFWKKEIYCT